MICPCDVYFLGCFKHCKQIDTGAVKAQMTGVHHFTFHYNNALYCRDIFAVKGASFFIPNQFLETAIIQFDAINPDGTQLTYDGFTCFKFKNQLGFEIPCETETNLCQNTCEDQCP